MERGGKKLKKRHRMKNPGLEPTPLDMEIAKYLRFKVPRKSTMMQKHQVEYFVGSKAVDFLMDSKWATRKKGQDQLFVVRDDATKYLNELLVKKFFYRVMKTEKVAKKKGKNEEEEKEGNKNQSSNEKEETKDNSDTKLRKRKVKKSADGEEEKSESSESNKKKGKTKSDKSKEKKSKEKVKKRYKLSHHDEQVFCDSKDVYIWLYNPVSWRTIAMGIGVLLCVVAATLFPLWPPEVRTGVYYLSVTGGIFIGFIFAVAFARTILYGIIWLFTGGMHHLWILPNILADVGFFESFQPWYTYEYKGSKEDEEKDDEDEEKDDEDEQDSDEDAKIEKADGEGKSDGEEKSDAEDRRDSQEEADSQPYEDSQSQNSSEHSEEESQTQ